MSQKLGTPAAPGLAAVLGAVLVLAALAALFATSFAQLVHVWEVDPNYSHGYLVGPISLALTMMALRRAGWPGHGQLVPGLICLVSGIGIHLLTSLFAWPLLDFVALAAVLYGLAVVAGGRRWARPLLFPIAFLVFLFPMPSAWMSYMALFLQEWVSIVSTAVLNWFVVCYRQGTSLHLAGVKAPLVVAEECSGLRQIWAFFALAALLGKLSGRSHAFRAVLFLLAVPVAILANIIRILLMAFGAVLYGVQWMNGWLHHAPAAFSLPFGIAVFLGLLWLLERLWPAAHAVSTPPAPAEIPCPLPGA